MHRPNYSGEQTAFAQQFGPTAENLTNMIVVAQLRFAEGLATHLTTGQELANSNSQPFDSLLATLPADPAMACLLEPLVMPADQLQYVPHASISDADPGAAVPTSSNADRLNSLQCTTTGGTQLQHQALDWSQANRQQQPPQQQLLESPAEAMQVDAQGHHAQDLHRPDGAAVLGEQGMLHSDHQEQLVEPAIMLYDQQPTPAQLMAFDQALGMDNGTQHLQVMMC